MTPRTRIWFWLGLAWIGAFGPLLGFIGDHALPFVATGAVVSGLIALTLAVLEVAAALREAEAMRQFKANTDHKRV